MMSCRRVHLGTQSFLKEVVDHYGVVGVSNAPNWLMSAVTMPSALISVPHRLEKSPDYNALRPFSSVSPGAAPPQGRSLLDL